MKRIILVNSCEECPYCKSVIHRIFECTKTNRAIKDEHDFENFCPLSNLQSLEEEILCQNTDNEEDKIALVQKSWQSLKMQNVVREAYGSMPDLNP